MPSMGAWRPQRRLRHLRSIAARNLVLGSALKGRQASEQQANTNESSTSPAIDFAAGWALQCTLSAQFAGDAQPRPLYTSEQVAASPNPEWQPLEIGPHSEAAQAMHSIDAQRVRITIFAKPTAAGCTADGPQLQASRQQADATPPADGHSRDDAQLAWGASLQGPLASDAAQLRTSDSVDSMELLQGGACLAARRSDSGGSADNSRAPRSCGGSSGRRQAPEGQLSAAAPPADERTSRGRSSCAGDSSGAAHAQQAAAVHGANGSSAAHAAADDNQEAPSPPDSLPPPAAPLPSPFALEASRHGSGGVDGDSDGNSDYETASEEGGAGLDRAHSASPGRLRPLNHAGSAGLRSLGARSRAGSGDAAQLPSRCEPAAEAGPAGGGPAAGGAVPKGCRNVLSAAFQLDHLEFVGEDLAGVNLAFPPNTLLLELPDGWYAWPPPSELSAAASVASAAAIEAARASSLAPGFHDYVSSDAELWQAPPAAGAAAAHAPPAASAAR